MDNKPNKASNEYEAARYDEEVDVLPGTENRPVVAESFGSVMQRAVNRRQVLKGAAVTGATMVFAPAAMMSPGTANAGSDSWVLRKDADGGRLQFETVPPGNEKDIVLPPNYDYNVVLRWGDPLTPDAPKFDVYNQTGAAQAQQFGFNADLVLWYPLTTKVRLEVKFEGGLSDRLSNRFGREYPELKNERSKRALVVVNHEYTKAVDMFPDYDAATYPTPEQTEVEIGAHGFAVVELKNIAGVWRFDRRSPFNRRVTGATPMEISGPLRGSDLMKTWADPEGITVRGTLNNCAGGKTPWGTCITCEENFDQYFANFSALEANHPDVAALSKRIAAPSGASRRQWENHIDRFDLSNDDYTNEYNRFGYCVEFDPYDPSMPPKKRTACGRFKHEGAALVVAPNNQVVLYSGDDARFEYVYKFVTKGTYDERNRTANMRLLDEGTLYVARFDAGDVVGDDMGTGVWLELSTENSDLADWTMEEILLNTRGAADLVGATPMDRPEDVEASSITGKVYICMTNNSRRDGNPGDTRIVNGRAVSSAPDEANPRNNTYDNGDLTDNTGNQHGHIIEIVEDGDDATSQKFQWNILVKCGDPAQPGHDARFGYIDNPVAKGVSPISDPDNIVHDDAGNLWIATDGQYFSGSAGFGQNDGIFAVPVEGEERGLLRQFMSGIPRGEVCGPEFSGDNKTFFCAIQHPNDSNAFVEKWPLDEGVVSKPSLIAVRERRRKKIGY